MPSFKIIGLLVLEKIFKVFTIYGHGSHLGHVTIYINFRFPFPRRLHIKFGFDWPSGFREEDLLKWWTGGRRLDGYTISSPCEPKGSGELIKSYTWLTSQKFGLKKGVIEQ